MGLLLGIDGSSVLNGIEGERAEWYCMGLVLVIAGSNG